MIIATTSGLEFFGIFAYIGWILLGLLLSPAIPLFLYCVYKLGDFLLRPLKSNNESRKTRRFYLSDYIILTMTMSLAGLLVFLFCPKEFAGYRLPAQILILSFLFWCWRLSITRVNAAGIHKPLLRTFAIGAAMMGGFVMPAAYLISMPIIALLSPHNKECLMAQVTLTTVCISMTTRGIATLIAERPQQESITQASPPATK